MTDITFALQAGLADPVTWATSARKAEKARFEAFVVADHPGATASPFVALAAAAGVTSRIQLGTYVVNTGVRDPLHIASDVATLDLLSNGRAQLGIGAGHTPAEWAMSGRPYPTPGARVARLRESAQVIRQLLDGEEVTMSGSEITVAGASLDAPRPRRRVPMLVGGGNRELLRDAGAHADMVGIAGLGRTLADGNRHETRWHAADIDATIATIAEGARDRENPPRLDALVQHVEETTDAAGAAARLADAVPGLDPADALACPFVLIGTEADLARELREHRERWGISRFTVRADAFDTTARLIKWLAR